MPTFRAFEICSGAEPSNKILPIGLALPSQESAKSRLVVTGRVCPDSSYIKVGKLALDANLNVDKTSDGGNTLASNDTIGKFRYDPQ